MASLCLKLLVLIVTLPTSRAFFPAFVSSRIEKSNSRIICSTQLSSSEELIQYANEMLEQARQIREGLPEETSIVNATIRSSPWNVAERQQAGHGYRLYFDIGREPGTWMDPRWGASGKRIEFTLDVRFLTEAKADPETVQGMVKDNLGGTSLPAFMLQTAEQARLRAGFDEMKCKNGGYRIDLSNNQRNSNTLRCFVRVDGTRQGDYGDINIPPGNLYLSLPVFGNDPSQLSKKEGIVTVRQMGWKTGWRREESRIVGVFRAVPIGNARRMDKF